MRRLGDVLLSLLVLATSVGLLAAFGGLMRDLVSSTTWQATPCSVEHVGVDPPDEEQLGWIVRGRFAYEWDGEPRVSERLALAPLEFHEPGYAEHFISQRSLAEATVCLVNPRAPEVAVLIRSKSRLETAVWSAGVVFTLLIGILGIWLLAATLRPGREPG